MEATVKTSVVKTVKRLYEKTMDDRQDPHLALLAWRNTPTEQLQLSPIMYGRRTRTNLLMTNEWLRSPHDETAHDALREAKDKQSKASCNKTGECRGLYKHIIRTDDEPMQPSSTSSSATTTKTFNTAQQQQRRQPRIVTRSGRSGKPQPDS